MDTIISVIDFVKAVGPMAWKYAKYQIYHKDYVREFKEMQEKLKHRRNVIDANLKTQLKQPGKITNEEVEAWLEEAREEIDEKVFEDLICKGGCFTYICSSRNLYKKTQALNEGIFKDGEKYTTTGESLVVDDHSIEYCSSVFKEMKERLERQHKDIQAILKTQLMRPGKIARKEVEDWLKKAGQYIAIKVEDLIGEGGCSSSNNLEEKTEELKRILEEGKEFTNFGVSLVVDDHSIKGVPLPTEKCIAKDDLREEILELLRGDKVTRIAVCGMGGVGKTTIMKQVHNQPLKEAKFNKVIWVKVSKDFDVVVQQNREFDILKFQKSIALKLGLDMKEKDEDTTELAGLISQKLREGSYVIFLDDVWGPFALQDVGINGCKLVLTTRLQEVAHAMECAVILVKPLPHDEALVLFLEKVGSEILCYPTFKSDIEPFLNKILQKCNGLPLAIGTVAKTMRGKTDRHSWEMADKELSKSKEIVDSLKFSYDHLEERCKNCFLYCALYPEDYEIQEEELIEYWIEEGFIKDESGPRHLMNSEGHVILEKLIDNCLLEQVKKDCVSMHDLLREMALKISPQFMVKAGMALGEIPDEHEWRADLLKVSLMKNYITEIPSSMPSPMCPMLTTLLLSNNMISRIPEAFFYHMLRLKILDLSNNRRLWRLPNSVSKLKNLTTLLLQGCESLKEVPSLSNLGGLKKLDLFGTPIEEIPRGVDKLTKLKFLNLDGRLSEIHDGMFISLSKLQHLGVTERILLRVEDIGRLRKLESLNGRFSAVHDISTFVNSERKTLNRYNFFVGSYSEEAGIRFRSSLNDGMKSIICNDIDIYGERNWLPSDVQRLCILGCKDGRTLNDISGIQDATHLREVEIIECNGVEFVLSQPWLNPLQHLESLSLGYLDNLKGVCEAAPLPAGTFSSLAKIVVLRCDKLRQLLPLRLLGCLRNLHAVKVSQCKQMEEIIWCEYGGGGGKALEKLTLPKLQTLELEDLPELKSIYSSSSTVLICDSIKTIEISHCPKIQSVFCSGFNPLPTLEILFLLDLENLKSMFDEESLGLSAPATTSSSLVAIAVGKCPKLKKVFSSGWLLGCFPFLDTILVEDCEQMEELISSSAHEQEKLTLPKLKSLELSRLPELKSICSSSTVLICDSIRYLLIYHCEKLKSIPLSLPFLDNGQPPSLEQIEVDTKERWESLEWAQSRAKDVLLPLCKFLATQ